MSLEYYYSASVDCPHRLTIPVSSDLAKREQIFNKLGNVLIDYGVYNVDWVLCFSVVTDRQSAYVYFKDKQSAMKFKLSWQ